VIGLLSVAFGFRIGNATRDQKGVLLSSRGVKKGCISYEAIISCSELEAGWEVGKGRGGRGGWVRY
jgi:hypothetical protein